MDILLASQSPRRRELLERMGISDFRIVISAADETVDPTLSPGDLVCSLAEKKGRAVEEQEGEAPLIIAADTVVVLDGAILGKPKDEADAFAMLTALSGRKHQVYTGVAVCHKGTCHRLYEVTEVAFRSLCPEEIRQYIATGEPMDKAGSYGIQGYGALLVSGITGDYYNVMGLPVCRLGQLLAQLGIHCLEQCSKG